MQSSVLPCACFSTSSAPSTIYKFVVRYVRKNGIRSVTHEDLSVHAERIAIWRKTRIHSANMGFFEDRSMPQGTHSIPGLRSETWDSASPVPNAKDHGYPRWGLTWLSRPRPPAIGTGALALLAFRGELCEPGGQAGLDQCIGRCRREWVPQQKALCLIATRIVE